MFLRILEMRWIPQPLLLIEAYNNQELLFPFSQNPSLEFETFGLYRCFTFHFYTLSSRSFTIDFLELTKPAFQLLE